MNYSDGKALKTVRQLRVGDRVMGTDGKAHKVTAIGNWGPGARFISIDGKPDGVMFCTDFVEMADGKQEAA